MRGLSHKVIKGMAGLFRPVPSFFDLCLAGFLALPYIKDGYRQEIYFVFYIIFLICISMGLRPRREYHSLPLMLLSLWAFIGVFIHSFVICEESITMRYLNMYLLSEGFIYILFGSLFILTVVRHSKNTRIFYLLIPIALFSALKRPGDFNKTFILSLGLAVIIYFILSKRFLLASVVGALGLIFAKLRWASFVVSFACRPLIYKQLIKEICKHPIVGSGFYHGLEHPNEMLYTEYWGWLFRHCDWLSIGAYLGIPVMIFVTWFFISSTKRIGVSPALMPLLVIGIMSMFQLNMFKIERAGIYLLTIGLCLKQSQEKKGGTG